MRLIECTTDMTTTDRCDHSEDAGVICQGRSLFYFECMFFVLITIMFCHK